MISRLIDLGVTTPPISDTERREWRVYGCECGTIKKLRTRDVRANKILSCGCLRKEKIAALRRSHGRQVDDPTYGSWAAMRSRCGNPANSQYHNYGGRGIVVCPQWSSFESFLHDMGERPTDTTLDRIDTDGPYSPDNCRWATDMEQRRNKRNNARILFGDKLITISELSEMANLPYSVVFNRIRRYGWTAQRAVSTPKREPRAAK